MKSMMSATCGTEALSPFQGLALTPTSTPGLCPGLCPRAPSGHRQGKGTRKGLTEHGGRDVPVEFPSKGKSEIWSTDHADICGYSRIYRSAQIRVICGIVNPQITQIFMDIGRH